jgi:hypothetical protein
MSYAILLNVPSAPMASIVMKQKDTLPSLTTTALAHVGSKWPTLGFIHVVNLVGSGMGQRSFFLALYPPSGTPTGKVAANYNEDLPLALKGKTGT